MKAEFHLNSSYLKVVPSDEVVDLAGSVELYKWNIVYYFVAN